MTLRSAKIVAPALLSLQRWAASSVIVGVSQFTSPEFRPTTGSKLRRVDEEKLQVRSVTYDTFRPNWSDHAFPASGVVERDGSGRTADLLWTV